MCNNNIDNKQFGLICLYGDLHHQNTNTIWMQVMNFVENNSNLPILCTRDMNDIMHLMKNQVLVDLILGVLMLFVIMSNSVPSLILDTVVRHTLGQTNAAIPCQLLSISIVL